MYIEYPRCPICQSSMVRCKRYSGLMKKIHSTIGNICATIATLTLLAGYSISAEVIRLMRDVKIPDQILTIVKKQRDNDRCEKLTELFLHVINLFQKLSGQIEIERDKLLKSLYEHVEKNNSIFLTRQQWSDLEHEYNRLLLIDHFRTLKESLNGDFKQFDIDTLNDILFGPNPFSKFACQVCKLLLNEDVDNNNDKWKSILLNETEWKDFEKDRLICDGKWVVCPESKRIN